jgi:hypothetical protein
MKKINKLAMAFSKLDKSKTSEVFKEFKEKRENVEDFLKRIRKEVK